MLNVSVLSTLQTRLQVQGQGTSPGPSLDPASALRPALVPPGGHSGEEGEASLLPSGSSPRLSALTLNPAKHSSEATSTKEAATAPTK